MIIYFVDRNLEVLGHASTTLPVGFRISDDSTIEELDTGVNSFSCTITYTGGTRTDLESVVQVGLYILKQSNRTSGNEYDSLYQIVETEYDTKAQEIQIYAEDAGLDLLNKTCPAVALNGTLSAMMNYFLPSGWTLNLIDTPTDTFSYAWDGESTATERLMSVANLFGCELYYSFEIEQLKVRSRFVNVISHRGTPTPEVQLRLNYEIDSIRTVKSITELVTGLTVTGGTPEGSDTPINLINYDYTYTDANGDVYAVDKPTGQMRNLSAMERWSSEIDTDGLWTEHFDFDTQDKAVLAGQARAYLQKHSQVAVNYEVSFNTLPAGIEIGDRVMIIDDAGGLYLEARLLRIETSISKGTQKAVIGEYILRNAGISEKVAQLANDFQNALINPVYSLEIVSSNGDVFIDTTVATNLTAYVYLWGRRLTDEETANAGTIKWYDTDSNTLLGTGRTYTITEASEIDAINVTAKLES